MSNAAWWAAKIGNPTPQPTYQQPQAALPGMYRAPAPQYAPPPAATTPSAKNAATCPECGGSNYLKVGEQITDHGPVAASRCYDCGYPLRQTGSGAIGTSSSAGGATPAQQVSTTNNFNPGVFVGRLS